MSSHKTYTIGWICAIPIELSAAKAVLDKTHEKPNDIPPDDNNCYTFGTIGAHNVVIAVLPAGEYGICSAARVAGDMRRSFPTVRASLMVGIGGGAPSSEHDIRLGDIVVSIPRNGQSGVIQYDFGKAIQEQEFQLTGFLNQPPTVLRTAVAELESKYKATGNQLTQTIRTVLESSASLQTTCQRPEPGLDRLFRPEITHTSNCKGVCGDDPSKLVWRPDRTEAADDPRIHYGLIASANQLMKDALIRNKLAAEHGVMCFEMEAGGLMNDFPCLVVRGITDYSDTHKNDHWQGYAAMVAAAYAKDLLCLLSPAGTEAEKSTSDQLHNGKSF
jgi:nucleoside phosphorylase